MLLRIIEAIEHGIEHRIAMGGQRAAGSDGAAGLKVEGLKIAALHKIDLEPVHAVPPVGMRQVRFYFLKMHQRAA